MLLIKNMIPLLKRQLDDHNLLFTNLIPSFRNVGVFEIYSFVLSHEVTRTILNSFSSVNFEGF